MVKAFSRILQMSNFQGSLVQFAFYGGYFAMAFPAALFIKRYSYKAGILVGLGLYATGALLFIPGSMMMVFWPFLVAYFILTCGLSFLETSANPYILAMGAEETATRRLNLAQSFNPMGSLLGMFVAQQFILARLNPATAAERAAMGAEQLAALTAQDLAVIRTPYSVSPSSSWWSSQPSPSPGCRRTGRTTDRSTWGRPSADSPETSGTWKESSPSSSTSAPRSCAGPSSSTTARWSWGSTRSRRRATTSSPWSSS